MVIFYVMGVQLALIESLIEIAGGVLDTVGGSTRWFQRCFGTTRKILGTVGIGMFL